MPLTPTMARMIAASARSPRKNARIDATAGIV
jgi:hypothetical protein